MLTSAVRFLREQNDLTLIAHVSPDGDTLGSCLALYLMAKQMGKHVQVVCEEPVPAIYRFLPSAECVLAPQDAAQTDAVMSVDCADLSRTGACETLFTNAKSTFNIDHHGTNQHYAADNFVRNCAATGELVYELLIGLKLRLTKEIASCLFAALATDTGNFSYSNTTPDTFRIAAELVEAGIDLPGLNRSLFRTIPYRKVKLRGLAISKMELACDGRLGLTALTQADLLACGATGEDTEGIIDSIRDIDTVEIAILLREDRAGRIRVSLRGKSRADVSAIAVAFGGGGHRLAAGCTLDMPIADAAAALREKAVETLSQLFEG